MFQRRSRTACRSRIGRGPLRRRCWAPLRAAAADSTVTISQGVDPVTMDPLKRTITPTQNVSLNMFDTLLRHDRDGKLIPWLATSWKHVAPTVWEFKLRRGVTFWNGDPLTSADVKFSVEKIKDPAEGSEQGPRVNTIARVETPDAYTVRYVTFRPTAIIPGYPWTTLDRRRQVLEGPRERVSGRASDGQRSVRVSSRGARTRNST
jgi:ABC-type transport system substrate-binding protein